MKAFHLPYTRDEFDYDLRFTKNDPNFVKNRRCRWSRNLAIACGINVHTFVVWPYLNFGKCKIGLFWEHSDVDNLFSLPDSQAPWCWRFLNIISGAQNLQYDSRFIIYGSFGKFMIYDLQKAKFLFVPPIPALHNSVKLVHFLVAQFAAMRKWIGQSQLRSLGLVTKPGKP